MLLNLSPSRRTPRRAATVVLLILGAISLVGCGSTGVQTPATETPATETPATETPATEIAVTDAWVRATTGTDDPSMTAAFMTLDNPGDTDVVLESAASPVAGKTELHEMAMVDNQMVMQPVQAGIVITAGRGKLLQPGGYHVMLMGMKSPLAPGDEVELTLVFSNGTQQTLMVPVKAFTEEEGHYHAPGTDPNHSHAPGTE